MALVIKTCDSCEKDVYILVNETNLDTCIYAWVCPCCGEQNGLPIAILGRDKDDNY